MDAAVIKNTEINFTYKYEVGKNPMVGYYVVRMEGDYGLVDRLTEHGVDWHRERQDSSVLMEQIIGFLVPFLCIIL